MYTTLTISKTLHLAQTDQASVTLTRFLALPDSNISPTVTISVLGHVVVNPTCMTTGAILTVTGQYFGALIIAMFGQAYSHRLYTYGMAYIA